MDAPQPILCAELFVPLNGELIALLRSLQGDEWNAPTAAPEWSVKDVASHLLDTCLRRLSAHRDGLERGTPASSPVGSQASRLPRRDAAGPAGETPALRDLIHALNREGVAFGRHLSPPLLIDLLDVYGRQLADFMESLDPYAPAKWGVSWAGEESSPMWFDVARELTERWHHQQQIRDATNRPPLYDPQFFRPVLDAFVRALPFTYRDVEAADGTQIALRIVGESGGTWTIARRAGSWQLFVGCEAPTTTIELDQDSAWRLFTKGLARAEGAKRARVTGDARFGDAALQMLCIVD